MRRLLVVALLAGCGASKPRTSRPLDGAPTSAAPVSAPEAVVDPQPDPTATDVELVGADEPEFAGSGQVFPNASDLFTLEGNHLNSMAATGRTERAKHAFWLERVDGESRARRLVHCSTARAIVEELGGASPQAQRDLERAGVEPGRWVLRVGRDSATSMILYRHIVKHHRLEYLGRTRDGAAIHRYVAPRRVPGEGAR